MKRRLFVISGALAPFAPSIIGSARAATPAVSNAIGRSYPYDLVRLFPGGSRNPNDGAEVFCAGSNYHVVVGNAVYHFESAKTKALFEKDPGRYLPGSGGRCLLGWYRRVIGKVPADKLPPVGDPRARTFGAGVWHFHGGKGAEAEFEEDADTINERTINTVTWIKVKYGDRYDRGAIG